MLIEKKKRITLVAVLMLLFSILFFCFLPLGHDLWYHMYRIGAMSVELQNDFWGGPIRILSDTYNGYGYAAPLFYGDLFLYIPALLLKFFGGDIVFVYKLCMIGIWIATFFVPYLSVKRILGEEKSFYLAFFNTFSVVCVTNLCIRSAIAESFAYVFLIPLLVSFYAILYMEKDYRNWLLLAISLTGIMESHNMTAMLSVVLLVIWCLVDIKRLFKNNRLFELIKAAILFICLNASFVFPMLEEMLFQKHQTPTNDGYQKEAFVGYSLDFIDFFVPYDIKNIFNLGNTDSWHPGAIALFPIAIAVVYIVFLKKDYKINKKIILIFIVSNIAMILLWFKPFIYIQRNFMAFLQFPWRTLVFITMGGSIFATYVILHIKEKKKVILVMGMSVCFAFFSIGARYAYQAYIVMTDYEYVRENNEANYHKYFYKYDKNEADNLYLPEGVAKSLYIERGETVTSNYEDVQVEFTRENGKIYLTVSPNTHDDLWLELPLYMYKGYAAYNVNESTSLIVEKSKSSLVEVNIPASDSEERYVVYYKGTLVQDVCNIVTFGTLIILLIFLNVMGRKKKK